MHVTFLFAFSSKYAKTRTSKFRKVVQKHSEGLVGSIIWILLEIYFPFQQWKNFENPLRIKKVIAMSLVYYVFGTRCSSVLTYLMPWRRRRILCALAAHIQRLWFDK